MPHSNNEMLDLFSLKGKVIVITGATGFLGQKHAEAVAAYGGIPVLLDLVEDAVIALADRINQDFGAGAVGFAVDITDEAVIEENAKLLMERYGKIDGLVNNAANNPKVEDSAKKKLF